MSSVTLRIPRVGWFQSPKSGNLNQISDVAQVLVAQQHAAFQSPKSGNLNQIVNSAKSRGLQYEMFQSPKSGNLNQITDDEVYFFLLFVENVSIP